MSEMNRQEPKEMLSFILYHVIRDIYLQFFYPVESAFKDWYFWHTSDVFAPSERNSFISYGGKYNCFWWSVNDGYFEMWEEYYGN
jgi:hypothetical protein